MRTIIILLSVSFIFLLAACSKKNNGADTSASIAGTWHLYNVSGGFAGINEFYDKGDVVWEFDANTLNVQNADSISATAILIENGSYSYSIVTADSLDANTLFVDSAILGSFDFEGTNFYISQLYLDGFLYHFKR